GAPPPPPPAPALHDALPISPQLPFRRDASAARGALGRLSAPLAALASRRNESVYFLPVHEPPRRRQRLQERPPVRLGQHPRVERSEEHTSELQSHLNLVCRL